MLTSNELWEKVRELGIEHSNHASDLYIPVNEVTQKLISEYEFKKNVTLFKNQIDGKPWYDIPFAYGSYWEMVAKKGMEARLREEKRENKAKEQEEEKTSANASWLYW